MDSKDCDVSKLRKECVNLDTSSRILQRYESFLILIWGEDD